MKDVSLCVSPEQLPFQYKLINEMYQKKIGKTSKWKHGTLRALTEDKDKRPAALVCSYTFLGQDPSFCHRHSWDLIWNLPWIIVTALNSKSLAIVQLPFKTWLMKRYKSPHLRMTIPTARLHKASTKTLGVISQPGCRLGSIIDKWLKAICITCSCACVCEILSPPCLNCVTLGKPHNKGW